jgi:hypothetical protein
MVNRQRIALAVLSAFSLLPITVQAGAGGTPTAPAAGTPSEYCCQRWETVRQGEGSHAFTFYTGTGCIAIGADPEARNVCQYTVVKCRGEFYTPNPPSSSNAEPTAFPGRVDRCLTP